MDLLDLLDLLLPLYLCRQARWPLWDLLGQWDQLARWVLLAR